MAKKDFSLLEEASSLALTDLLAALTSPAVTPATEKATLQQVFDLFYSEGFMDKTTDDSDDISEGATNKFLNTARLLQTTTVGVTGADYETIGAAIAAGKTSLLVIANTTETADIAVPAAGLEIFIKRGITVAMGAYTFTFAGNYDLTIKGEGTSTITTSYTAAAKVLFATGTTTGVLTIENVVINSSTCTQSAYVNGTADTLKMKNVKLLLGNVADCGVYLSTNNSYLRDCWIVGGGVNTSNVIRAAAAGALVDGLYLTGSFAAGGYVLNGACNWNNIVENASTGMRLGIGGLISNVRGISGQACAFYMNAYSYSANGAGSKANNIYLPTGAFVNTFTSLSVSNGIFLSMDSTSGTPDECSFTNLEIRGNANITGSNISFSNCRVEGNLVFNDGGADADDNNKIEGCHVTGVLTLSGGNYHIVSGSHVVGVLTVASGVIGACIKGNRLDAVPADSGVGTIMTDNSGQPSIYDKRAFYMKNTDGDAIAAGDIVILKAVAAGNEVMHTTTGGDDLVFGVSTQSIANNASGYIRTSGKVTNLKVDGTTDIAIGDFISTFTTAGIGKKAAAGETAIAIALEAYTTDDSSGVIDALIISPRKVGAVV